MARLACSKACFAASNSAATSRWRTRSAAACWLSRSSPAWAVCLRGAIERRGYGGVEGVAVLLGKSLFLFRGSGGRWTLLRLVGRLFARFDRVGRLFTR